MCVAVLPWISAAIGVASAVKGSSTPSAPSPSTPAPSSSAADVSQAANDATRQLQLQKGIAATMTNGGTGVTSTADTLSPTMQSKKTVLGG